MRSDTIRRKVVVAALAVGVALAGTAVPAGRAAQASELAQGGHGSGPRVGNGTAIQVQNPGSGNNNSSGGQGTAGGNQANQGGAIHVPSSPVRVQNTIQVQNPGSGNNSGGGQGHTPSSGSVQALQFSSPTTLQVYHHAPHYVQYVPVVYHVYYGPFFQYDYEWYFYRHISFPWLYVVYVEEPVLVCTTEYYFYDGLFYCFVGEP